MRTPAIKNKTVRCISARKKLFLAVVAAGFAIISAVVLPAPAALAQSPSPMSRCTNNMPPNETQTMTHYGNQVRASFPDGTNPLNGILRGDVVKVTITGAISIDRWPGGQTYGPEGATGGHETYWKSLRGINWPFPNLNAFSSVARWNNNPGGWVRDPMRTISLRSCTWAPNEADVRLLYYINDPDISDNGGQWTIKTDVYRATTTCRPGYFYWGIYGCILRPS